MTPCVAIKSIQVAIVSAAGKDFQKYQSLNGGYCEECELLSTNNYTIGFRSARGNISQSIWIYAFCRSKLIVRIIFSLPLTKRVSQVLRNHARALFATNTCLSLHACMQNWADEKSKSPFILRNLIHVHSISLKIRSLKDQLSKNLATVTP